MSVIRCPLCGKLYHANQMSEINNDGDLACPRCIFVIALYAKRGINKRLTTNCLMPNKLCGDIQRILNNEFLVNPKAAYEKYLSDMIHPQEECVRISQESFRNLAEFPFVILNPQDAEDMKIANGKKILITDGRNRIYRNVFHHQNLTKKQARRYGFDHSVVACFVPGDEK